MLRVITQFVLMRSTKKAVVAVTGSGVVTGHSETSSHPKQTHVRDVNTVVQNLKTYQMNQHFFVVS